MFESSSNTLFRNLASDNILRGIAILSTSSLNFISSNLIFNNLGGNVQDNSSRNIWLANAYGDYSGAGIYSIPGTAGAIDTTPTFLDRDRDGLPDWYEQLYALDPLSNDSALDPDNDGFTNLQEYVAGTDPTVSDLNLLPTVTSMVTSTVTSGATSAVTSTTTTAEGFGIVAILRMLGVLFIARRRHR